MKQEKIYKKLNYNTGMVTEIIRRNGKLMMKVYNGHMGGGRFKQMTAEDIGYYRYFLNI